MLLDELSNLDFGWPLVGRFDGWEMGPTAVRIVGGFPLLRGFAADGVAICSDVNFARLCGRPSTEAVQFGFLKLRDHNDAAAVEACRALREVLPPDVVPYSRAEILRRETEHWVGQTATGKLFAFGVLVATIVAAAVIYQVLSNDVRDHLAEYATLKAMGHTNGFCRGVVIVQALLYAGSAYLIAAVIGFGLYRATEALAGIPMRMTPQVLGLALLVTALIGPDLGGVHAREGLEDQPCRPVLNGRAAAHTGRGRHSLAILAQGHTPGIANVEHSDTL